MISIEALTKAQQLTLQDKLEQHIAKIISLPCKNIFGQQYISLQEVLAWRTEALAIVKARDADLWPESTTEGGLKNA